MRWYIWSLNILEDTPMEMTTEVEQDAYLMGRKMLVDLKVVWYLWSEMENNFPDSRSRN
jgi:hypothetical protein